MTFMIVDRPALALLPLKRGDGVGYLPLAILETTNRGNNGKKHGCPPSFGNAREFKEIHFCY